MRTSAQRIVGETAKKRGFIAWISAGIWNHLYTIATWGNRESARREPLSVPFPDYFFADERRKRDKQEAVHGETSRCPASRESEVLRVRSSNRGQWGQSEARIHSFEGRVQEQKTGDQIWALRARIARRSKPSSRDPAERSSDWYGSSEAVTTLLC